ncbi:Protein YIPF6 [Trichinella pseudospiralis]|uniref:Protein YIPF6 n=1 Tax=Trichinella pseudospiralis TaxID=6337 RepID=A0A0V0XZF5_TRIPS|nr:Protein YIPF6 [Trichinella pseudospiralis]
MLLRYWLPVKCRFKIAALLTCRYWDYCTSSFQHEENVIIQHDKFLSGNMDADGVIDTVSATLDEPVLETILRDLKAVSSKLRAVMLPRSENQLIRDWDLWGPLFLCVFIAVMLHSNDGTGKEPRFTEAFAITWFGACIVTINIKLLGGTISVFQSLCVLGYCLLPLCIAVFFCRILSLQESYSTAFILFLRLFVVIVSVIWSCYASITFLYGTYPERRKALAVYPLCFFYIVIACYVNICLPIIYTVNCLIFTVSAWCRFFVEAEIKHHFSMQSRIYVGTNKAWFFVCCILFWLIGCIFSAVSIWMLVDPRRRISLDYVNFYENDPLLRYAISLLMAIGICLVAVGLLGCLAALKEAICLIGFCFVAIILLLISQCIVSALVAAYYDKVNNRLDGYLYNLIHERYGRQVWVTELLDSIQFYQKCCGSNSSEDYMFSYWQIVHSPGTVYYVPVSCCAQRQDAYPPHNLYPIDQRCVEYTYDRQPEKAVHKEGCYDKIMTWINENCLITFSVSLIGIPFEVTEMYVILLYFIWIYQHFSDYRTCDYKKTVQEVNEQISSCIKKICSPRFHQVLIELPAAQCMW